MYKIYLENGLEGITFSFRNIEEATSFIKMIYSYYDKDGSDSILAITLMAF